MYNHYMSTGTTLEFASMRHLNPLPMDNQMSQPSMTNRGTNLNILKYTWSILWDMECIVGVPCDIAFWMVICPQIDLDLVNALFLYVYWYMYVKYTWNSGQCQSSPNMYSCYGPPVYYDFKGLIRWSHDNRIILYAYDKSKSKGQKVVWFCGEGIIYCRLWC